jgi:ankyrin repeat protein
LHAVDGFGQTPLRRAKDEHIARLFLSHSADVHAVSNDGETPLHFANALGIAKALIEQGADARAVDNSGQSAVDSTAMFLFTPEERHSLVSFLVGHGAERAQN